MSLEVYLKVVCPTEVFSANVTHNLSRMAVEAGIYDYVWAPDIHGIVMAEQLIEPLRAGIARMEADPERFKRFDAPNGCGTYADFLPWLKKYLAACEENPTSAVTVAR